VSRNPVDTALRAAAHHGTPYVHTAGPLVVLVLEGTHNRVTGEVRGVTRTRMCSSSAMARAVAARVLADLQAFPAHPDVLAVSALYAEAAYRFACLRARRAA
jgi:hypothetical protein